VTKIGCLWSLLTGALLGAAVRAGTTFVLPSENRILPWSLELERKTEPWCPGDCALAVPFVARYRRATEQLVFVGVRHSVVRNDPTMRAVEAGFAAIRPEVVILEGFPTVMGENPSPLVAEARRHASTDADDYARSEAMLAATLALSRGVPFLGGEPTREEERQVLKTKGFTDADIAFSWMLGGFAGALRSGDIPDTSIASLEKVYPRVAESLRQPTDQGGWHLDAFSLDAFLKRYRDTYGIDITHDNRFPLRTDIVDPTRHGQQSRVDNMTRDRHLLGLIEQQLTVRREVLVVYGADHWSDLSMALEKRLGKPSVTPFLK
jgi:hypothetical protein